MTRSPLSGKLQASGNLQGALWMVGSCLAATAMSASVKLLSGVTPVGELTFLRNLLGLMVVFAMFFGPFARGGAHWPRRGELLTAKWPLHLLRGVIGAAAMGAGFYALHHLPFATATVQFFSAPLFVTALAPLILRERVGWRRWSATAVGFFGVAVALGPSAITLEPASFIGLLSAAGFAAFLLMTKQMSATETTGALLISATAVGVVATAPAAALDWAAPDAWAWAVIAVITVSGVARNYCDVRAYAAGEASFVSPFQYLRLVFVMMVAAPLFDEFPGITDVAGGGLIVASTLYIAQREARLGLRSQVAKAGPPAPDQDPTVR